MIICPHCHGAGFAPGERCPRCRGVGEVQAACDCGQEATHVRGEHALCADCLELLETMEKESEAGDEWKRGKG